jgi:hypothetical protein
VLLSYGAGAQAGYRQDDQDRAGVSVLTVSLGRGRVNERHLIGMIRGPYLRQVP